MKDKQQNMKEEKIDVKEVERASALDLLPNGDRVHTLPLSTEIDAEEKELKKECHGCTQHCDVQC